MATARETTVRRGYKKFRSPARYSVPSARIYHHSSFDVKWNVLGYWEIAMKCPERLVIKYSISLTLVFPQKECLRRLQIPQPVSAVWPCVRSPRSI